MPRGGNERQQRQHGDKEAQLERISFEPEAWRQHENYFSISLFDCETYWKPFVTLPERGKSIATLLVKDIFLNASTQIHSFPNGLTLLGEPTSKQAVAWSLLVPAGSATEPEGKDGLTSVLESVSYRGAGERDSRQLSDALDDLGIERGGGSDVEYTSFGGATLGLYLPDALKLYADIVRRPRLPEDEWEAARDLSLQSLDSLEDSPARKMFVQMRRNWFTSGHRRASIGTREGLESLVLEDLKQDHAARFCPDGAILAVAGGFDWAATVAQVEELFGDWTGSAPQLGEVEVVAKPFFEHIEHDTEQQQIGIAYAGVPSTDADFYAFRVATDILSGGMGARLFSEVREKRGLVYSVSASAASHRGFGFTLAYAGTKLDRAQETLDVLLAELQKMREGVREDELERSKVRMTSGLIMGEESSRARAGGIARDWWMLERVRTLDEVLEQINAVTVSSILAMYERFPPQNFSIVTLGPQKLERPTL
ncbi:insulinase family protein [bacterium]|nr:MAG: insulinase family protein [bacterium]